MLGPGVYVSQDINKARPYGDGTILTVSVNTGVVKMITNQAARSRRHVAGWRYVPHYHLGIA